VSAPPPLRRSNGKVLVADRGGPPSVGYFRSNAYPGRRRIPSSDPTLGGDLACPNPSFLEDFSGSERISDPRRPSNDVASGFGTTDSPQKSCRPFLGSAFVTCPGRHLGEPRGVQSSPQRIGGNDQWPTVSGPLSVAHTILDEADGVTHLAAVLTPQSRPTLIM
jgi:hypothetical protein